MNNKIIVGFGSFALTLALLTAPALAWRTERQDVEFTGKTVFSAPVEVNSSLTVGGTQLTASAAELNTVADGIGTTAAELNAVSTYFNAWTPGSSASVAVGINTNTHVIVISVLFLVVTASGETNTHVYPVTIGAPPAAGYVVRIAAAASSNSVSFLDAANLNLAGGFTVSVGRVLTLVGQTATNWLEVSRSAN